MLAVYKAAALNLTAPTCILNSKPAFAIKCCCIHCSEMYNSTTLKSSETESTLSRQGHPKHINTHIAMSGTSVHQNFLFQVGATALFNHCLIFPFSFIPLLLFPKGKQKSHYVADEGQQIDGLQFLWMPMLCIPVFLKCFYLSTLRAFREIWKEHVLFWYDFFEHSL